MATATLTIDPHRSEIRFSLRHLVISQIRGEVTRFHGMIRLDTVEPTRSNIDLVMDAGSLETGDPERDQHLRSPEFLDVGRFPEMRFRSREVSSAGGGGGGRHYVLTGDLTIRDVCREVRLDVEDRGSGIGSPTGASGPFAAHTTINRRDFGLRWNQDLDSGGVVVGDKIDIHISLAIASRSPDKSWAGSGAEPRSFAG
jgi:polyisoprenoid-binding protein YceI